MPTLKTLMRAAVMLAAAIMIVQGWQLYGPTTKQLKSWTAQIAERVHIVLSDKPQLAPASSNEAGELLPASALPATLPSVLADNPSHFESSEFPAVPPIISSSSTAAGEAPTNSRQEPGSGATKSGQMPVLLARLEQLGAVEPQLAAWGSSGNLYRFCCRAAIADSPYYARHFEAVAAEPLVAVEQVVSKVEAWRIEQRVPTYAADRVKANPLFTE